MGYGILGSLCDRNVASGTSNTVLFPASRKALGLVSKRGQWDLTMYPARKSSMLASLARKWGEVYRACPIAGRGCGVRDGIAELVEDSEFDFELDAVCETLESAPYTPKSSKLQAEETNVERENGDVG